MMKVGDENILKFFLAFFFLDFHLKDFESLHFWAIFNFFFITKLF
jgi:hypothetical protein